MSIATCLCEYNCRQLMPSAYNVADTVICSDISGVYIYIYCIYLQYIYIYIHIHLYLQLPVKISIHTDDTFAISVIY